GDQARGERAEHGGDPAAAKRSDGHASVSSCPDPGDALSQPSRKSSLCCPSSGGAVTSSRRSPSKLTGGRTVRKRPPLGCGASMKSCRCCACGSSGTSAVVYIGAC